MCGNDCNIIMGVQITLNPGAAPKTTAEPKGAKPPVDEPTAAQIKAALEKEYAERMKDGGCEKKCKCTAVPGKAAVPIDHTGAGNPWEPFTLYTPPLPEKVDAPNKEHPTWVSKGTFQVKYNAQPGVCEPNLNVK
jgi:hypothetical protein